MKKSIILSALISIGIITFACKKKESTTTTAASSTSTSTSSTTTGAPPPVTSYTFSWTENNGSVIVADSAFWTTGNWGTGVRAYKGGMTNFFEINWSGANNTSVGAKTMNASNSDFTFLKGNDTYVIATSQTISITGLSSNLLSGNGNIPVTGGTITTLNFQFMNLPKR
jgi:hypothetical protein